MRWLKRSLATVGVVVIVLVVALAFLLGTGAGQRWLIALATTAGETATGWQIAVTAPRLDGLDDIRAQRIVIADRAGTWLTVSDLAIDWHPWALLHGQVSVADIDVGRIELTRLPASDHTAPAEEPTRLTMPELPTGLRIERLTVGELALAPAVAGRPFRLAARFALTATERHRLAAKFDVHDLDTPATRIAGTAKLMAGEVLTVNVDAADGPDGLLAGLADLPGLPAISARLTGSGPLADFAADLTVDAAPLLTAQGHVGADLARLTKLSATATLAPGADFARVAGVAWSNEIAVDLSLAQPAPDRLEIANLTVRSGGSSVNAKGAIADGARFDAMTVTAHVSGGDLAPLLGDGIRFGSLTADGQVDGALAAPTAGLKLTAEDLAVEGVVATPQLTCDSDLQPTADHGLSVAGTCRFADTHGPAPLPDIVGRDGTLTFELALPRSFDAVEARSLRFASTGLAWTGHGQLVGLAATDGPTGTAEIDLERLGLGWFDAATGVPISGTVSGRIDAVLTPGLQATGRLDLTASGLSSPDPALAAALRQPVSLAGTFAWQDGAPLRFDDATLAAGWALATGSGTLEPDSGAVSADVKVQADNLAALPFADAALTGGSVNGTVHIGGNIADMTLAAELTGQSITGPNLRADNVKADIDGRVTPTTVAATVHADGRVNGASAKLDGKVALMDGQRLQITSLTADVAGATLRGQVTGDLAAQRFAGDLSLRADSLAGLGRLAGQQLDGALQANFKLDAAGHKQSVVTTGSFDRISWTSGDTVVTAGGGKLDGTVGDVFGTPRIDARVQVQDIGGLPATIEQMSVELRGPTNALHIAMNANGNMKAPFTLNAEAEIAATSDRLSVTLQMLAGELAGGHLKLHEPTTIDIGDGTFALAPTELRLDDGSIRLAGKLQPTELSAQVKMSALPVRPLSTLLTGTAADGAIDGDAALAWTDAAQTLTAKLTGTGLRLPDTEHDLPPGTLTANAAWDGRTLSIDGEVRDITSRPATFTATLPLHAGKSPPVITLATDQPLDAQVDWQGKAGPLLALAPIGEHQLDGDLTVALKAGGTLAHPKVSGRIALTDGTYEHLLWGTLARDITVEATGRPDGTLSVEGRANDGGDGTITLNGDANLLSADGLTGKLTVDLRSATVLRRDDLRGQLSARLSAAGTAQEVKLAGKATIERLDITIPERLPASAQELPVREINGGDTGKPPPEKKPGPTTVLDLTVDIPGRAFVRGRGLESEWSGNLTITGTSRNPHITGTLKTVRGKLAFAGRDFEIESGTLRFAGGDDVTPEINILIRHARQGFSADIRLVGPVTAPKLQLSSSPALPDDEILSRVIFGKSVRQLSAVQAFQLTQSIAQISGVVSGGPGILDKARRALGADVLSVDGGEEGGAQVGVGKYVLDNVYIGVRQGTSAGSSEVEAQVELTPNITLESELGQNAQGNIGLKWKHDY